MTSHPLSMTPYQQHRQQWKDCKLCELCNTRNKVVFARGKIPCQVLFVGEAPGEGEDTLGDPFVGPAGRLLDRIISKSVPDEVRWCAYNLLGCIPIEQDTGDKATVPDDAWLRTCSPKIVAFARIANPSLIINVGRLSQDWLDPQYKHGIKLHKVCSVCHNPQRHTPSGWVCKLGHGGAEGLYIPQVHITHPSAILRGNLAQQGLSVQRCIVTVANAVYEHITQQQEGQHHK